MKTRTKHQSETTMSLLVALIAALFGLSPLARAVSPPPDGGYTGNNTAEGTSALFSLTSGVNNTAVGFRALYYDTNGSSNSGTGYAALYSNTGGSNNTAMGLNALRLNTDGSSNTAEGAGALYSNSHGTSNTAVGWSALNKNTVSYNTAVGYSALASNTTGGIPSGSGTGESGPNTAVGSFALNKCTIGGANVAVGYKALANMTTGGFIPTGGFNTAVGFEALANDDTSTQNGDSNAAFGYKALASNTKGYFNVAVGPLALESNTTGASNTAIGLDAGFSITGSGNIDIGSNVTGTPGENTTTRIGVEGTQTAAFVAGINGKDETGGGAFTASAVYVGSNGQLGTTPPPSSRRFKQDITPMGKLSEAILLLKPVRFQYKNDGKGTPQFGLIAEDAVQADADLVTRDQKGDVYGVRYDAVNAMLLNEFLKEHRKVEQQQTTIAQLKSSAAKQEETIAELKQGISSLTATVREQAAQIHKVSAQLATIKPAPQLAENNQ